MASDNAISRLTSPPGSPYLCTCCLEALKSAVGRGGYVPVESHLTFSGFLEAVENKCFICWRLYRTLDSPCQECLQTADGTCQKCLQTCDSTSYQKALRTLSRYERSKDPERVPSTLWTSLYIRECFASDSKIHVRSDLEISHGKWNFDPETFPDLARAIKVIDQGRDVSFSHLLVNMDGYYTDASEISQWTKSRAGFVDGTAWEDTIDLIRQWILACDSGHRQCNDRARDTSWFPTRILDLAPPELAKSDETAVKVIKREQAVPGERYVTLSHRWNPHIPKLTSNLEARFHKIPFEDLTKTFRDFITVARLLHVRYAWIDSLCIIQESEHGGSDWKQECLTMDQVYRNSFCNLSADWATDSDGFFLDRKVRQFDLPTVNVKFRTTEDSEDSEDNEYSEYIREQEFEYLVIDNGTWQCEVTNSPINSRGWVLQERFLSPRVLHFCRNEVIFECCEGSKSERFRGSLPAIDKVAFEPFKNFVEKFAGTYDTAACYRVWSRVPGIYTRCALTVASDKLVAISGIARYLKTFLVDDVYVMGVWASIISTQMLWSCDENTIRTSHVDHRILGELEPLFVPAVQTVSTPLRQCKGPTFSWVSTDRPVSFPIPYPEAYITWKPVCKCPRLVKYREGQVPFDDEPITEDIFDYPGEPRVELKVSGLLCRARLIDTGSMYLGAVFLDENGGRLGHYESSRLHTANGSRVFLDFGVDPSGIPNIESRVYFCMLWADTDIVIEFMRPRVSIILELVDSEMGRFRRIGTMTHLWSRLQPVVSFSGWNYDPKTQLHTIYII